MTSNKNKKSTPHKSPHKSSPHKPHRPGKAHKSPKEKVAPAGQSLPILPLKTADAIPAILPPTRRILFSQSLKKSNSQQPFSSHAVNAVNIDHQKTKKHTLSSPATKFSDDRPFKKPCLSSPSPAKRTKLLPVTPQRVNGRERTIPSSDDEDENENESEDNTPNPPSRKRKSNAMAGGAGNHKKTPPPRSSVTVVIPPKQQPSSSFSIIHPNSPAVQKIDMTVLRLEKEELQHRLESSLQQVQKAMSEVKEWENECKETTDVQDNLNRLLRAEIEDKERLQEQLESFREQAHGLNLEAKNWERKWTEIASENDALRKRFDSKMKTRKGNEPTTQQWRLQYISENEKTIKLQRELKQMRKNPEPLHLTQKIEELELELSNLRSKHHSTRTEPLITTLPQSRESAPNPQPTTQLITDLTTQIHTLQQQVLQTKHLSLHITQLTASLDFQSDLLSQAERTHGFETTALKEQIAQLKMLVSSENALSNELADLKKGCEKMREEILDKDEEIEILNAEFEEERERMRREVERLEGEGRVKGEGLRRMGVLVAGWVLKWRSLGEGETEIGIGKGEVPGVEGVGICVDGVRM
ncbi:uncharacterized protein Bfra_011465 [Botrytis fragariae]|uniref:Uncharacterized protein n=1 Tax=Botrytis fragariae TaxID=1964551 RepID=A0A8H6EKL1_9HELO|nr:uncharacterized protein Bfra_011465 [Botrytis fragariae]KAF5875702.1 hypothetical protein Bfra_011465 [Botrytis fragariae]